MLREINAYVLSEKARYKPAHMAYHSTRERN